MPFTQEELMEMEKALSPDPPESASGTDDDGDTGKPKEDGEDAGGKKGEDGKGTGEVKPTDEKGEAKPKEEETRKQESEKDSIEVFLG